MRFTSLQALGLVQMITNILANTRNKMVKWFNWLYKTLGTQYKMFLQDNFRTGLKLPFN